MSGYPLQSLLSALRYCLVVAVKELRTLMRRSLSLANQYGMAQVQGNVWSGKGKSYGQTPGWTERSSL